MSHRNAHDSTKYSTDAAIILNRKWITEAVNLESHLSVLHRKSVSVTTEEWFVMRNFTFRITWYQSRIHTMPLTLKFFRASESTAFSPLNSHEISHITWNISFLLKHEQKCFTALSSEPLTLFSTASISHIVCGLFRLCYRLWQKSEMCMNAGQVSFWHLEFIWIIKYFSAVLQQRKHNPC